MMLPVAFHVVPGQENRIRNALKKKKGCRIKVTKSDTIGPHRLLVTPAMLKRYQKAAKGGPVPLHFKHEHLVENMNHQGGFLPLIAALAPVLGGIAAGAIERGIAGSGLHGPYRTPGCHGGVGSHQGQGLYLNPYPY